MKITYVYSTLATTGGTERMIIEKANYLAERFGYDITIITCYQLKKEQNFFKTSPKVKQINLEIPYYSQYKYNYPKRLWIRWRINKLLRSKIYLSVKQENPDILIGVSRFNADYISSIKCRAKKIIECHVIKNDTLLYNTTRQSLVFRFFWKVKEYIYFWTIKQNADVIVTLTENDRKSWKRAKHTKVIPNFSSMPVSQYSDCKSKRVIAIGHLRWVKGFGRLIEIWSIVSSKHPDWHLDIYGDGDMFDTLQTLIKIYRATNVTIHGVISDISHELSTSSICTITSYFEGFSLVTLEAMKHGVPCVAFNCSFGPGSIIDDAKCGFLVDDGDIQIFADRVCRLIEDIELRNHFSQNCIERAKQFDIDRIMNQWRVLLEDLCADFHNI